jgi:hypothetical protein
MERGLRNNSILVPDLLSEVTKIWQAHQSFWATNCMGTYLFYSPSPFPTSPNNKQHHSDELGVQGCNHQYAMDHGQQWHCYQGFLPPTLCKMATCPLTWKAYISLLAINPIYSMLLLALVVCVVHCVLCALLHCITSSCYIVATSLRYLVLHLATWWCYALCCLVRVSYLVLRCIVCVGDGCY